MPSLTLIYGKVNMKCHSVYTRYLLLSLLTLFYSQISLAQSEVDAFDACSVVAASYGAPFQPVVCLESSSISNSACFNHDPGGYQSHTEYQGGRFLGPCFDFEHSACEDNSDVYLQEGNYPVGANVCFERCEYKIDTNITTDDNFILAASAKATGFVCSDNPGNDGDPPGASCSNNSGICVDDTSGQPLFCAQTADGQLCIPHLDDPLLPECDVSDDSALCAGNPPETPPEPVNPTPDESYSSNQDSDNDGEPDIHIDINLHDNGGSDDGGGDGDPGGGGDGDPGGGGSGGGSGGGDGDPGGGGDGDPGGGGTGGGDGDPGGDPGGGGSGGGVGGCDPDTDPDCDPDADPGGGGNGDCDPTIETCSDDGGGNGTCDPLVETCSDDDGDGDGVPCDPAVTNCDDDGTGDETGGTSSNCSTPPTCSNPNSIGCTIVRQTWQSNCSTYQGTGDNGIPIWEEGLNLENETVELPSSLDTSGYLARQCPVSQPVAILGQTFAPDMTPWCVGVEIVGYLIVFSSLIAGIKIISGGF